MSEIKTGSIDHLYDSPDQITSFEDGTKRMEYFTTGKRVSLKDAHSPSGVALIMETIGDDEQGPNVYILSNGVMVRVGGEGALKDERGEYRSTLDVLDLRHSTYSSNELVIGQTLEYGMSQGKAARIVTADGKTHGQMHGVEKALPLSEDPIGYFVSRLADRNKALTGDKLGYQDNRSRPSKALIGLLERYS